MCPPPATPCDCQEEPHKEHCTTALYLQILTQRSEPRAYSPKPSQRTTPSASGVVGTSGSLVGLEGSNPRMTSAYLRLLFRQHLLYFMASSVRFRTLGFGGRGSLCAKCPGLRTLASQHPLLALRFVGRQCTQCSSPAVPAAWALLAEVAVGEVAQ